MNDLYDIWFTKEELSKLDEALHHLKDKASTPSRRGKGWKSWLIISPTSSRFFKKGLMRRF